MKTKGSFIKKKNLVLILSNIKGLWFNNQCCEIESKFYVLMF